ncbi:MAG: hypothetical protein ABEJ65_04065, partial [bacterium]
MDENDQLNLPMGTDLEAVLKEVEWDRSRGSRELTSMIIEESLIWTLEQDELDRETVKDICERISTLRPEMASVCTVGYLLWSTYKNYFEDHSSRNAFAEALRDLKQQQNEADEKIARYLEESDLDDKDILTFSRSSTVLSLLTNIESIQRVVVLHSFPGEEGIDLADELSEKLDVTFAYDVEAGYFLPEVDAFYTGVDSLFNDGSIVNKTGTKLLARSAESTPVRAVSDIWKLTHLEAITDVPRYPSPKELPHSIQREHPLFETVEPEYIDTYITDRGL